ncbi:jg10304 [Pararge aegeria aegeria]|uniref:Jg10304 protein n=1 Tax=Pararge aegeria aegeria TaxID=348720 RepID=A0A8S4RVR1_9NEOP|nr:jg10304 [Pararge aegeria aegeria]
MERKPFIAELPEVEVQSARLEHVRCDCDGKRSWSAPNELDRREQPSGWKKAAWARPMPSSGLQSVDVMMMMMMRQATYPVVKY